MSFLAVPSENVEVDFSDIEILPHTKQFVPSVDFEVLATHPMLLRIGSHSRWKIRSMGHKLGWPKHALDTEKPVSEKDHDDPVLIVNLLADIQNDRP